MYAVDETSAEQSIHRVVECESIGCLFFIISMMSKRKRREKSFEMTFCKNTH
jgi:hypothetical protein